MDRNEVIVVPLTADERFRIGEKARLAGMRSIEDYMRVEALRAMS